MHKEDCIFCEIARKNARSKIVFENDKYIAFENINPQAPIHILVIPKDHVEKTDAINGVPDYFWFELISAANEVIKKFGLDQSGYRLVNNGAGYHVIDHEHLHILGGDGWKPKDGL